MGPFTPILWQIGELYFRARVTCSVTNFTKVSIIIYYWMNTKVKILQIQLKVARFA